MKPSLPRHAALTLLLFGLAIPLALAQTQPQPIDLRLSDLHGEATFPKRSTLPPGAMLHVSLVGRVVGAEYLPIATQIVPARRDATPFKISFPKHQAPPGPYRLQAWIVADNRLWMQGRDPQTTVENLENPAQICLKTVAAPQNIDGIGDGLPLAPAPKKMTIQGVVSKLDRRALAPDSRLEIQLRDVSLADAPSKLVLGQVIQLEGGQLPKNFEMELEAGDLPPRRRYALSARVLENNKLTYITNTLHEVTPENLDKPFQLRVVSASPVADAP